jgi:hypothetical protein
LEALASFEEAEEEVCSAAAALELAVAAWQVAVERAGRKCPKAAAAVEQE